jgi:hypothetical protein
MWHKSVVVGAALLCFYLSYTALNTDVGSDPKLTLLVSQALVEFGTVRLDAYAEGTILGESFDTLVNHGYVVQLNGHYFNYYPVGPSLISTPFVALARLSGLDMTTRDSYALQRMLAALTTAVVFALIYSLARCYVPMAGALVIGLISILGSSLISTLGTALWSHNYTVIVISLVLWLFARRENGRSSTVHPVLVGLLLFLAFLCRASSAAFILPALLYLLWTDRRAAVIAGIVSFLGLAAFLGWSAVQTGQILPEYYKAGRLQTDREPLWVGIVGNLFSPSRGIFIFSPFLIPVVAGLLLRGRMLFRRPLLWLCLLWFGLYFLLTARAASWWGGWSFGARILTDLWPGLVLLTAIVWQTVSRRTTDDRLPLTAYLLVIAYLALGLPAIFLHAGIGLNSQVASRWNGYIEPRPLPGDPTLGDLFNWRYAQPLANTRTLCALGARWFERAVAAYGLPLVTYSPGHDIFFDADQLVPWPDDTTGDRVQPPGHPALLTTGRSLLPVVARPGNTAAFQGWGAPYEGSRWSQCYDSEIYLQLGDLRPDATVASLTITARANGPQAIEVLVNGRPVGTLFRSHEVQTTTLDFPAAFLEPDTLNVLRFIFPDAHYPSLYDQRPLGMGFVSLVLEIH